MARAFGNLQIEADSLAVDQNRARVNQLLAGAVVALVAAEGGKWKEKFHGLGTLPGGKFASEMEVGAETDAVELRVVFDVAENGAEQVSYIIVESEGRQAITRGSRRLGESGVDREFQIRAATKCDEVWRSIGDEVRLRIEVLHHAIENRLESGLQCGECLRRGIARGARRIWGLGGLQS